MYSRLQGTEFIECGYLCTQQLDLIEICNQLQTCELHCLLLAPFTPSNAYCETMLDHKFLAMNYPLYVEF